MAYTQETAPTHFVNSTISTGTEYAYRRFGAGFEAGGHLAALASIPLLLLIHFRGTMDWWDPRLINGIAAERQVILVDYPGVGQSTGTVATTASEAADQILDFLNLIDVTHLDVLGFSIGGFIAPMVHLNSASRNVTVRKLIVAASTPSAGDGLLYNSAERNAAINRIANAPIISRGFDDGFNTIFFRPSNTSQAAGRHWFSRVHRRTLATSHEPRSDLLLPPGLANQTAISAAWNNPTRRADGDYDRLRSIAIPTFIAEGQHDFMIPTANSFAMQQTMPDARLKIFPDSGHGFLYQFAHEFARDVNDFLGGGDPLRRPGDV